MQPKILLAFWAAGSCWTSSNTPKFFSELHSIHYPPSPSLCLGLPWLRCRPLLPCLCWTFWCFNLSKINCFVLRLLKLKIVVLNACCNYFFPLSSRTLSVILSELIRISELFLALNLASSENISMFLNRSLSIKRWFLEDSLFPIYLLNLPSFLFLRMWCCEIHSSNQDWRSLESGILPT